MFATLCHAARRLTVALACLLLPSCMGMVSSSYYVTDDPSLSKITRGCLGYSASLHPIKADDRISPTFSAGVRNPTRVEFWFQFSLAPAATFLLLEKDILVTLPNGQERLLPMRRAGGVSFAEGAERGLPISVPVQWQHPGIKWHGPIIWGADLVVEEPLPPTLVFRTPLFKVNEVGYPSRTISLHLESRTSTRGAC
jgi:hypothetical protein